MLGVHAILLAIILINRFMVVFYPELMPSTSNESLEIEVVDSSSAINEVELPPTALLKNTENMKNRLDMKRWTRMRQLTLKHEQKLKKETETPPQTDEEIIAKLAVFRERSQLMVLSDKFKAFRARFEIDQLCPECVALFQNCIEREIANRKPVREKKVEELKLEFEMAVDRMNNAYNDALNRYRLCQKSTPAV